MRVGVRGHLTQLFREVHDQIYPPVELYEFHEGFGRGHLEEMFDFFDRWNTSSWMGPSGRKAF